MALALCLVFGGILLGISVMGFFLLPLPCEAQIVFSLTDATGDTLEYALRSYSFLSQIGLVRGAFVIAVGVLSPENRKRLALFEKQYPFISRKDT